MTPVERETFKLHAELDDYRARIARTQEIIQEAIERFEKPYIAYSGGKDSMVLLDLCLKASPDILVEHWYFGKYYFPEEMEDEVLANARHIGAKNIIVNTSQKYNRAGRSSKNIFFPAFFGGVQKDLVRAGYDLAFVGLRSQESAKRRRKTVDHFRWNGAMYDCYPLRDLSARDVWSYIVSHNLPYCGHYDRYGALLGIERVRMSTFFDPEFEHIGASNIDGLLMPGFKHV